MKMSFKLSIICALALASCTSKNSGVLSEPRLPASVSAKLIYYTYKVDGNLSREEISASRWLGENGGFSEGGREDYLAKFYSANTRGISLKNIRHAACFEGRAQDLQATFFSNKENRGAIRNVEGGYVTTKPSEDGKMIGISFTHKQKGSFHFRLTNCDFGKSGFSESLPKISSLSKGRDYNVTMKDLPKQRRSPANAAADNASGFLIEDKAKIPVGLPTFELRADYEQADAAEWSVSAKTERPWQGMDLTDEKERIRFVLLMQKYFYEGMATQDLKNPDMNFIAKNNKTRFWCHMPWMQVGISGREAVHGLTKELDLRPSKDIYPLATPGSDWGVAYFNAPGCRTLKKVFGSISKPNQVPDFSNVNFEQGTVIVKILFTTANFPQIENAFKWHANASEPGSPERSIKVVRHIQMDMTIKDSSLKGANALLGHNLMTAFYYDPTYNYEAEIQPVIGDANILNEIPNLPSALKQMRPMGLQVGYSGPDTGDTIVFPGAKTNGSKGRLNGPADNPKTSCLGCHGPAGTGARMVPGFLSMDMANEYKNVQGLDFNQQLAVAKDYYETTP